MKHLPVGWLFVLAVVLMGAQANPGLDVAPPLNAVDFWDTGGTRYTDSTVVVRCYAQGGLDSTDTENQVDFTFSSTYGASVPDSTVEYTHTCNCWRIDTATDSLIMTGLVLVGKYGPANWADSTMLQDDAVIEAKIKDGAVTDDKLASGIDGGKISSSTIAETSLEAGVALENLLNGSASRISITQADGGTDTTSMRIDTLLVELHLLVENFLQTEGDGGATPYAVRILSNLIGAEDVSVDDELSILGELYREDMKCDSLTSGATVDTVLVPSVGDLKAAGYEVKCAVFMQHDFDYLVTTGIGVADRRSPIATPFKSGVNDSVYVDFGGSIFNGMPYCVECWGVGP